MSDPFLDNLKVGDVVVVHSRILEKAVVTKITPSRARFDVEIGNDKRRMSMNKYGVHSTGTWDTSYTIRELSEAMQEQMNRQNRANRLKNSLYRLEEAILTAKNNSSLVEIQDCTVSIESLTKLILAAVPKKEA